MSKNPRPPRTPWLVPYLVVKDADKALDFYERAFGFARVNVVKGEDGKTTHAEMAHQEAMVMFAPEGIRGSTGKCPASLGVQSPVALYVYCDDVDALCARARQAGATVAHEPADMFWGDRMCMLTDPDGHTWNFATHLGQAPPGKGG
jgi:uncharacterized glyoxalase superfamily protein PhnB